MKIVDLRVNNLKEPLGFDLKKLRFSWRFERATGDSDFFQSAAQILVSLDDKFDSIIYDSGKSMHISNLGHSIDIKLSSRTKYYWKVMCWTDKEKVLISDISYFETGKIHEKWHSKWISAESNHGESPILFTNFDIGENTIDSARLYIAGFGLYKFRINDYLFNDEHLLPGHHSYDFWLQYQTFDVTKMLKKDQNSIEIFLGEGWYRGRFGYDGINYNLYGNKLKTTAELVIKLSDGNEITIPTDESWKYKKSHITFNDIYDGECQNYELVTTNMNDELILPVTVLNDELNLSERLSLPVKIMDEITVKEVINTPSGETVLDFGQNLTGWVRFTIDEPIGNKIELQFGEVLQNDNFYRENLRSAKSQFTYISDGKKRTIEPFFTFYGFRYVKIEGLTKKVDLDNFTACVIYSDLETTGNIKTSNKKVNKLFKNALWGQKGNFLDVPTDCPQRDERMGWTGDAQIFASTASFNMYTPAFYNKYLKDLRLEQIELNGSVPYVVPMVKPANYQGMMLGHGSTAWGDAATIIPWTLYTNYGDKTLLEDHYPIMRDWVEYIYSIDKTNGNSRLWQTGFHFSDWLGLTGNEQDENDLLGNTDPYFVSSAYYFYSTTILSKAARALNKIEEAKKYQQLANEIKSAIQNEYFSINGKISSPTQTNTAVSLFMDIVAPEKRELIITQLKDTVLDNNCHLNTGFVGTPYLNHSLSDNGLNSLAYSLLLNEEYPSWLFSINMGATTIWERWNSLEEDGSISGTGMNSLNHYAYGSIVDWMYKKVCGIVPLESNPGYSRFIIYPHLDSRIDSAICEYKSPKGTIKSGWKILSDTSTEYNIEVPFDSIAEVTLPNTISESIIIYRDSEIYELPHIEMNNNNSLFELFSGSYKIVTTNANSRKIYLTMEMTVEEALVSYDSRELLYEIFPALKTKMMRLFSKQIKLKELILSGIIDESINLSEYIVDFDEKLLENQSYNLDSSLYHFFTHQ